MQKEKEKAILKELTRVRQQKRNLEETLKMFFTNPPNIFYPYWVDIKECNPQKNLYPFYQSNGEKLGYLSWAIAGTTLSGYEISKDKIANLPAFLANDFIVGWKPVDWEEIADDSEYFESIKKDFIAEFSEFIKDEEQLISDCRVIFHQRKGYPYPF